MSLLKFQHLNRVLAIVLISAMAGSAGAQDIAPELDFSRKGIRNKAVYTPQDQVMQPSVVDADTVYVDDSSGSFLDNIFFFGGPSAFANKGDDNNSNNFGMHGGFNMSLPTGVGDLRYQLGFSNGTYNWMGREGGAGTGGRPRAAEMANYLTVGVYRRSNVNQNQPISFGIVFDHFMGENWGEEDSYINISQLRIQAGLALSERSEVGFWGTHQLDKDFFSIAGADTGRIQAQQQAAFYLSRRWWNGAVSTSYIGLAEDPGDWLIGTRMINPISDRLATYANFHYVRPSTSVGDNNVNAYSEQAYFLGFGMMINFGGKLRSNNISGASGMPLLPVADQGIFGLNIPTGNL